MHKLTGLFCTIFYLFSIKILQTSGDDIEYSLIHNLLKKYDPSIRPSVNHNYSVNVTFGLALTQIIDIDERNMIVTTNCWLTQIWIDAHMNWNPSDYNNIQSIHIPVEKLWKPDILLVNNADQWSSVSSVSTNLIVHHDGNITWLSTVIFKSSCSINVRYFPFDEQICDLIFASWTFDMLRLNLDVNSKEGDSTNFIKNGEWHLVNLSATRKLKKYSCCEELYPEVIYTLVLRRRPLYYVFNMVFPCLLITLVAFLGFYLPPDSGEKVSIGITTLLSITVFLMLVAESMPPTSDELPLLGIYYAITICIVTFSTGCAVITLNINNKGAGEFRPPKLVRKIFFNYLARILRFKLTNKAGQTERRMYRLVSINGMNERETNSRKMEDFDEYSSNYLSLRIDKKLTMPKSMLNLKNLVCTSKGASDKVATPLNVLPADNDCDFSETTRREGNSLTDSSSLVIAELERMIEKQFSNVVKNLEKLMEERDEQKLVDKTKEIIQGEWKDVAMISDQIICFVFSALTLIACIAIFTSSPHIFPLSAW